MAAFLDLALYHPEFGYYARAAQRSGRGGDFFTSVDVGPLFGELLAAQVAEMFDLLSEPPAPALVEAGAGNGRLSADILRAARHDPSFYDRIRLHLVEASAAARDAQRATLGGAAERLVSSSAAIPEAFEGVLIANELLDAMPVHQLVMREDGLREIYVTASRDASGLLTTTEGPLSTPALRDHLDALGARLEPGWRVEVSLQAVDWVRRAARALGRGFLILIDYGHEARELYSVTHSSGTLTAYSGHKSLGPESAGTPWLERPGEQDLTAHVDFTSIRRAAEAEGLTTLGFLDQTYFLMGLLSSLPNPQSAIRNPQWKTLIMPGGLGSALKVLILCKGVGAPTLRGLSFKVRAT